MPIMTWDATLDIGVEAMNAEHRDILDIMNKIYDAYKDGKTGYDITLLVDKLGKVCVSHFADEEKFMEKVGFPGLKEHKILHEKLLTKYGQHAADIQEAGGKVNDAFFGFLKFWLSSHIKGIDIKYAAHANMKKAG